MFLCGSSIQISGMVENEAGMFINTHAPVWEIEDSGHGCIHDARMDFSDVFIIKKSLEIREWTLVY